MSVARFQEWIQMAGLDPKDYQTDGVTRMLALENDDTPQKGGFLADEMGLGKTIQMLGIIYANPQPKTLIVLPCALVDQWETEIIRLLGHRPLVYHGARKFERHLDKSPLVITTYNTLALRRSGDKFIQSPLLEVAWDRVIYDEAHHLRNQNTNTFKGANLVKTRINWFVTGTPVQNKLKDVYSLMQIIGLEKSQYTDTEFFRGFVQKHFIRRTKTEVGIDLPPVTKHLIQVDWEHDDELNIATDLHSTLDFSGINESNVDRFIAALSEHHLPALLRMRQVCLMTSLMSEQINRLVSAKVLTEDDVRAGMNRHSKMDAVMKTLTERKDNGKKKIIFCHFRGEIDYIAKSCHEIGLKTAQIDGRTGAMERDAIMTSHEFDAIILQIQTSCEGLNLQQYSEIYFTSPHWNPSVEDQAIARAHRIGQTQSVEVFKFVMKGFGEDSKSIDQYIHIIQELKRDIAKIFQ